VTPEALRRLLGLADARKARALTLLDAALREDRRLAAEAQALARTPAEDAAPDGVPMPMRLIGLRHAWAEARLAAIRRRRTDLGAEIARLRALAAVSFGKHQALDRLVGRSEAHAAGRRAARAEREAPPPVAPRD